jgi:hypothetical protein
MAASVLAMLCVPVKGAPARAASVDAHAPAIHIDLLGQQLTPEQVSAVREAWKSNSRLSWQAVEAVIAAHRVPTSSARPQGGSHNGGPCGNQDLYAGVGGFYDLYQNYNNPFIGVPIAGNTNFFTNAPDTGHAGAFVQVGQARQHYSGTINPEGTNATTIIADGWSLTDLGAVCGNHIEASMS